MHCCIAAVPLAQSAGKKRSDKRSSQGHVKNRTQNRMTSRTVLSQAYFSPFGLASHTETLWAQADMKVKPCVNAPCDDINSEVSLE